MVLIIGLIGLLGCSFWLYREWEAARSVLANQGYKTQGSDKEVPLLVEAGFTDPRGKKLAQGINALVVSYNGSFADLGHVRMMSELVTNPVIHRFRMQTMALFGVPPLAFGLALVWGIVEGSSHPDQEIVGFAGLFGIAIALWIVFHSVLASIVMQQIEGDRSTLLQFVATNIFPHAAQSMFSGFSAVQQRMDVFSRRTEEQLGHLQGMLDKQSGIIGLQHEIIEKVKATDLTDLARTQLEAFIQLESLAKYYGGIQGQIEQQQQIIGTWLTLAERSGRISENLGVIEENVSNIGADLRGKLDIANQLLRFFESHMKAYGKVDEQVQLSATRINNLIQEAWDKMVEISHERIMLIREMNIKEDDMISRAFEMNRDNLKELQRLPAVEQKLGDLSGNMTELGSRLTEIKGVLSELLTEAKKEREKPKGGLGKLFGG